MAAVRRSIRRILPFTAESSNAHTSEDISPPVKSARTVKPAARGNRSCSGVELAEGRVQAVIFYKFVFM